MAWLTNFKVLGLCLNRGPLRRPLTFLQMATLLLLPVTLQIDSPVGRQSPPEATGKIQKQSQTQCDSPNAAVPLTSVAWSVLLALFKFGVLGSAVYLLSCNLNVFLKEYIYAVALYSLLGSFMDSSASIMSWLCGYELAPQFNQPYLSTSLSDFWGKRWNIVASSCLRFLIYEPIFECRIVAGTKGTVAVSKQRRLVGMLASFVSSGVVHEIMYWYISHLRPTGKWFVYFSVQGPLCIAEHLVKRWLKRHRIQPPAWLLVPVTNAALLLFAHFFFFPPVVDHGIADHVTKSVSRNFSLLAGLVTSPNSS
ncbi:hypothetical protein WJX74_009689 [Apatococcus lobatus]|uniref:Wax synthase domain-containing protein n=1 Tax=Apatococcus lobatus TaxID=904363 RepID=A0AAW1RTB5_9CHLO